LGDVLGARSPCLLPDAHLITVTRRELVSATSRLSTHGKVINDDRCTKTDATPASSVYTIRKYTTNRKRRSHAVVYLELCTPPIEVDKVRKGFSQKAVLTHSIAVT